VHEANEGNSNIISPISTKGEKLMLTHKKIAPEINQSLPVYPPLIQIYWSRCSLTISCTNSWFTYRILQRSK